MAGLKRDRDRFAWMNYVGLAILVVCYIGALWNVVSNKRREAGADVIRIVHWQLELGVRDGLQEMIDRFEAYKAEQGENVKVVQIPIPERAYSQYVTTQLIGGTAPDMIQVGMFPPEYLGRYFYPLSKPVQNPNPFLARRLEEMRDIGNPTPEELDAIDNLEHLSTQPWMNTFTDGLRGQFNDTFQEYFGVGFSTFTVRMFYNKKIFRQVLGHERPPSSFQELLEFSRRIEAYSEEQNLDIVPIASSKYQVERFRSSYLAGMTADLNREYDLDLSGYVEGSEIVMAFLRGDFTPWNPQFKAGIDIVQELATFFPKGFMALGREDASFDFIQGDAAMITSGSWDALSFLKKISDQPEGQQFEVGIFDLPMVSDDHPRYGPYADGRSSEAGTGTGFAFGITRYTRQEELCIEFLQFCTTPQNNERLNEIAGWIPVIHGAEPTDLLKPFEPNYVGYFGMVDFVVTGGGKVEMLEDQEYWPLISREITYDMYAERLWEDLPTAAATDYKRMYDGKLEGIPNREARRSAYLATAVFGGDDIEVRKENEARLQRAVQPLMGLLLGQRNMDFLMNRTKERIESREETDADPEFNQHFFEALEREMGR